MLHGCRRDFHGVLFHREKRMLHGLILTLKNLSPMEKRMLHGETIFMGFLVLIKVNYVGMFHVMLVIKNKILGDICDREDVLDKKKGCVISPPFISLSSFSIFHREL